MASFQQTVLVCAVIVLVISLIFISIALMKAQAQVWPPMVPNCPDYWTIDGSGNDATCNNVQNLGTCSTNKMNFNAAPYTGSNGLCAKYKWANNCGVTWDGITYGVQNPCSSSSST